MSSAQWLQNRPRVLDAAYKATHRILRFFEPMLQRIGFEPLAGLFEAGERLSKGPLFDCQMCGQCILHSTGMTCPMTCPKNLRNGPCGGVRANGHCEVKPEMPCVWVLAWERAAQMGDPGNEIHLIQPPVDRRLQDTSAWLNTLSGRDRFQPAGWISIEDIGTSQAHHHG